jgi:hypothetical protein
MSTRSLLSSAALIPLVLGVGVVAPASASHGGATAVRTSGGCSGGAHWKVKAKPDDGRIEVEGEIDSDRSGQVWHWALRHNGSRSASGSSTTAGTSGSFEVRRRMADLAGTDRVVFRATHGQQVCRGTVAL